jgi:hypothetical protein
MIVVLEGEKEGGYHSFDIYLTQQRSEPSRREGGEEAIGCDGQGCNHEIANQIVFEAILEFK